MKLGIGGIHGSLGTMFQDCIEYGLEVNPRGEPTRELIDHTLVVNTTEVVIRPRMSTALGWMELMQVLAGSFNKDALIRVAPRADHSLFTEQMAYGPRTLGQIEMVYNELLAHPFSRRAIISIADRFDNPRERPCTSTIQFLIREGQLLTVVNMRSWDLWWGAPYDLHLFIGLANFMARALEVLPGKLVVHAGSAHIYERHWKETYIGSELMTIGISPNLPLAWRDLGAWADSWVIDTKWTKGTPTGIRLG